MKKRPYQQSDWFVCSALIVVAKRIAAVGGHLPRYVSRLVLSCSIVTDDGSKHSAMIIYYSTESPGSNARYIKDEDDESYGYRQIRQGVVQ